MKRNKYIETKGQSQDFLALTFFKRLICYGNYINGIINKIEIVSGE